MLSKTDGIVAIHRPKLSPIIFLLESVTDLPYNSPEIFPLTGTIKILATPAPFTDR